MDDSDVQRSPIYGFQKLGTAFLCGAAGFFACVVAPQLAHSDPRDYVGKDAQVSLQTLQFQELAVETRFKSLQRCFVKRTKGWEHFPLRKVGNFIYEDWCRGERTALGCSGGGFRERAGSQWFSVSTVHYPREWPKVFGLNVSAGSLPAKGWGASFSWHEKGRSVMGKGLHVSFAHRAPGTTVQRVHLGHTYTFEIHEAKIELLAPGGQHKEFERLRASPESLRKTGVERLDALLAKVEGEIRAGTVQKCVYGPYQGGGIPPACTLTALDSLEQREALTKARQKIMAERKLLETHYRTFHALLMTLIPAKCWGA